ncbi:MAG: hypothetical protein R3A46_00880 [Thermomicrobiales bacterium]
MHASIFRFDLGSNTSPRERGRRGRTLATALAAVPGFVAFLALESEAGWLAGLCICIDPAALARAQQVAADWQREHGCHSHPSPCLAWGQDPALGSAMQPLITGEVIVQRGF